MASLSSRKAAVSARPSSRSAARALSPDAKLARNRSDFDRLLSTAARALAEGKPEHVLVSAAFAAYHASRYPIGRLMDTQLETLISQTMRPEGDAPTVDHTRTDGHVLHVLTEASGISGQSKSAVRWVQNDAVPADLAITHQSHAITVDVRTVVEGAGGYIHNLRKPARGGAKGVTESTLSERAHSLRAAMNDADLVVLHTLAHDPVPLAAASLPGVRPPIITKNYFANSFWLGWSITDIIANCAATDEQVTTDVRGFPLARQSYVPLPIDKPSNIASRADLRTQMLFNDRDVVAICVAAPEKLQAADGVSFADLVARLLKAVPELSIILVGPELQGRWKQLALRYPGRLHALGVLAEAQALFPLADLYIDSYPQPGPLAVLDAQAAGLAVVALETPAPDDDRDVTRAVNNLISRVRQLARSESTRREHASVAQRAVQSAHSGAAWDEAVSSLYQLAHQEQSPESTPPMPVTGAPDVAGRETRASFEDLIEPYRTVLDIELRSSLSAAWTEGDQVRPAQASRTA